MKKTLRLTLPVVLLSAILSACSTSNQTDTIKPTVSLSNVSSTVTQPGAVTLQATADDNKSVKEVDFYVDNMLVQAVTTPTNGVYQTTYTWQASQNGTHTVKAVAMDSSGNRSIDATQQVNVNIIVDVIKPVVKITADAPDPITVAGSYTLSVNATDNVGVVAVTGKATCTDTSGKTTTLISPSTTTTTSFSYSIPVTAAYNGTCTLTVSANDAAGNTDTSSKTITINIPTGTGTGPGTGTGTGPGTGPGTTDTQKPTVSVQVSAPNPITVAGLYSVTVAASDNVGVTSLTGVLTLPTGQTFNLTFDPKGGSQSIPVSAAYNGTSTLTVTAIDATGNSASATQQIVVNIQ